MAVLTCKQLGKPCVLRAGLLAQEDAGARLLTVKIPGLVVSTVYAPAGNPDRVGTARAIEIRAD